MSENKAKTIGIVLGGLTCVVGAALLFNYVANRSSSSNTQCFEEIDALGPPKKEANGLLSFAYYKEVFVIISKHSKQKFADEKKELVAKRRAYLKEGNMREYRAIVEQLIMKEESSFQDMITEVMDHIGLNEQEFMQMH